MAAGGGGLAAAAPPILSLLNGGRGVYITVPQEEDAPQIFASESCQGRVENTNAELRKC
jgi:hypothetical protein